MAWVCILECSDGSYYVGSTVDLERRVWEHQEGLGAAYTRHRRPVRLVWCAAFDRIDDAFCFEKRVQGWSRMKREALMDGRLGDLGWLSSPEPVGTTPPRRGGWVSAGFETALARLLNQQRGRRASSTSRAPGG
jgi:putative endonuclease